jgi:hypothetical protein
VHLFYRLLIQCICIAVGDPVINRFNPTTVLCLSQIRIWIPKRVKVLLIMLELLIITALEEFEDTKGVIRICKSKRDIQRDGQKKKNKRTNNDLQNITYKTKYRVTQTSLILQKKYLYILQTDNLYTCICARDNDTTYEQFCNINENNSHFSLTVCFLL